MQTVRLLSLLLAPSIAFAGVCDLTWNGDQLVEKFAGRPALMNIRLQDKSQAMVAQVSLDQVRAFQEAKERISRTVSLSPTFVICSDSAPNAFAIPTQSGAVVGVTVGMLKLVNGDRDQAGYILGHEIAHHTQNHMQNAQARDAVIGLVGVLVGAVLEKNTQRRYSPGLGYDIAQIGSSLVSAKFTRDQEREADEYGLRYMVSAGYNPSGAIQLANIFVSKGLGGIGLFFDSHPGWEERESTFKTMIANDPALARAFGNGQGSATRTYVATTPSRTAETVGIGADAQISSAQALFVEATRALKNNDFPSALDSLRRSAELRYAPAEVTLGYLYLQGRGVAKDDSEALRLFRLAADQGNALAQSNLGVMFQRGRGGLRQDDVEAVRLFRLAADQGNALGQSNLGFMFQSGRGGLRQDDLEAVRLYRLAANQGESLAQTNLGALYAAGRGGLPKDYAEAVRLYRLSADRGNALGRANLGFMYAHGLGGLPKDEIEAVRLFRLAADEGNAHGSAMLGLMYGTGRGGLAKNEGEALRLSRLAADDGSSQGQVNLGIMYAFGLGGLQKNDAEAVRFWRLASDQGHSQGRANLASMYAGGRGGLPKDEVEAVRLYRLAADQGNSTGQTGLGIMFANGLGGLPKDDAEAVRLFRLAAAQGHEGARNQLEKRRLQ